MNNATATTAANITPAALRSLIESLHPYRGMGGDVDSEITATGEAIKRTLLATPAGCSVNLLLLVDSDPTTNLVRHVGGSREMVKRAMVNDVCVLSDSQGKVWTLDLSDEIRSSGGCEFRAVGRRPLRCEDGSLIFDLGAVELLG